MSNIVYTIGHSNRELNEFIELLEAFNIKVLIDVRRWPSSSKYPHFNRDSLREELSKRGIKYVWLGERLGGYRSGGYEEYMKSDDYRRGVEELLEVLRQHEGVAAIMCSEKLWFRCHRRHISTTLTKLGYKVVHIIDKNRVVMHKPRRG